MENTIKLITLNYFWLVPCPAAMQNIIPQKMLSEIDAMLYDCLKTYCIFHVTSWLYFGPYFSMCIDEVHTVQGNFECTSWNIRRKLKKLKTSDS